MFRFLRRGQCYFKRLLFNPAAIALMSSLLLVAFVNSFALKSMSEETANSAERLMKAGMLDKAEAIYRQMLASDPDNLALHYEYLQIRFQLGSQLPGAPDRPPLADYYADLASADDTAAAGYYGLGWIAAQRGAYSQALEYFQKAPNRDQAYLNYAIGYVYLQAGDQINAEAYFQREIALGGNVAESAQRLASLYLEQGEVEKFRSLRANPQTAQLVGYGNMRRFLLITADWWSYLQLIFYIPYRSITLLGGLNALIICLVWMIFLTRIAVFNRKPFVVYLALLVLGMLSANASLLLSDLLGGVWRAWGDEGSLPGLISMILRVGIVEESMKILPVLVMVTLVRRVDEPFDLVAYGSFSALGFATLENALAFTADGLGLGLPRFLYSTIFHMAMTAIIGYSWAKARYLRPGNQVKSAASALAGLLLAATIHGAFDFFLGHIASKAVLVSYALSLIMVREYHRMVCNTLNHSPYFEESASRSSRLMNHGLFLSAAILLLLIGFLSHNLDFSTEIAFHNLVATGLSALPSLIVVAGALGRLGLVRGKQLPFLKFKPIPIANRSA